MTTSSFDYIYERRQSPFLALTRGNFGFLHTSPDRLTGVAVRKLSLSPLGRLRVPSGRLLMGDPFGGGLKAEGNVWHAIPPGDHAVVQTVAHVGEDDRLAALRTAYLSLVFDAGAIADRQEHQRKSLNAGQDPALAQETLSLSIPHLPEGSFSEREIEILLKPKVRVVTGTMCFADASAFEDLMPADVAEPGQGWLERLFEHGVVDSWFDRVDAASPWPRGASNHALPAATEEENVVLCQSGWGDGQYQAFLETDEHGTPVALHVDFQVIPFDPLRSPD